MRVVVLGGVGVGGPTGAFRPVPGQQGDVLAALVAAHPGPVSDDELIEALWPDRSPKSARNGLRVVVYRLRQKLDAVGVTVSTEPGGYVLVAETSQVDLALFGVLLGQARAQLRAGAADEAAARTREALDLWRGAMPFADHDRTDRVRIAAADAAGARGDAEDLLAEALNATGDSAAAAALAARLVEEDPLRERRWQLLMESLYSAGRQAEALRAFDRAATILREELGVDPGPALVATRSAVLEQRLADPSPAAASSAGGDEVRPRALVPAPSASFVGRDRALGELAEALTTARLVTLVAPGGSGKTRLALEHVARRPEIGVEWIDLAPLGAEEVLWHLADRFEMRADPEQIVTQLADALRDRSGLVVLDNCEHVVVEAAALAEALVRRCPDLAVLATSRAPLGCESEVRLDVAALDTDDAVDLLLQRSFGPNPRPRLEDDDLLEIVRRLDALPLAIELAAPLLRQRTPRELIGEIERSTAVLAAPRRSEGRHRRLADTIDWSLDLLPGEVVEVFELLGVMVGPFTRESAGALAGRDVSDDLSSLVEHSLVISAGSDDAATFRLLETVRVHACDRLASHGTLDNWRGRHARTFAGLATTWRPALYGESERAASACIAISIDQFRAAFRHAATTNDIETMVSLAIDLQRWFEGRRHYHEVAWILEVVDHQCFGDLVDPLRVLPWAAAAAWYIGDFDRARALTDETIDLAEAAGEAIPCAIHQVRFRVAANLRENDVATEAIVTWALAAVEQGDEAQIFEATSSMATGAAMVGEYEGAREYAAQTMQRAQERGNPTWLAVGHWAVALARYARLAAADEIAPDELEIVLADFAAGSSLAEGIGNVIIQGWCDDMVIACLRRLGRVEQAEAMLRRLMRRWRNKPVTTHLGLNQELKELVMLLAAEGRIDDAVRIARARRALPSDALMVPADEAAISAVEAGLGELCSPGSSVDVIGEALGVLGDC